MDVTTGRLPADKGTGNDPAMEWFYLGGLDNWRIAFNQDWDRAFQPPKKHFRSDNIDSQRGEAEWDGGNLYFNPTGYEIGRAHVCTPVTNAQLVCRLLFEKKNKT